MIPLIVALSPQQAAAYTLNAEKERRQAYAPNKIQKTPAASP